MDLISLLNKPDNQIDYEKLYAFFGATSEYQKNKVKNNWRKNLLRSMEIRKEIEASFNDKKISNDKQELTNKENNKPLDLWS